MPLWAELALVYVCCHIPFFPPSCRRHPPCDPSRPHQKLFTYIVTGMIPRLNNLITMDYTFSIVWECSPWTMSWNYVPSMSVLRAWHLLQVVKSQNHFSQKELVLASQSWLIFIRGLWWKEWAWLLPSLWLLVSPCPLPLIWWHLPDCETFINTDQILVPCFLTSWTVS